MKRSEINRLIENAKQLLREHHIQLPPFMWHEFWAEVDTGTSVVGEVSKTNADATDNFFLTAPGRFPKIDEDVPPVHLLCTEY